MKSYTTVGALGANTPVPAGVQTLARAISTAFGEESRVGNGLKAFASSDSKTKAYTFQQRREPEHRLLNTDAADIESLVAAATDEESSQFHNMTLFDIMYWLPDDLLYKVDRSTMHHSLEARVPFLDHRLVEASREIPPEHQIQDGKEKPILKQAVQDLLPAEILTRKKSGFSVPVGRWMSDPDSPLVERFTSDRFEPIDIVDETWLMEKYDEFRQGNKEHKRTLWRALVFQIWYENYVMERL